MEYIEKTLTGIITHGTNSITFTDDFITNESIIDVYFSDDDIAPTEQTQDGNRLIVSIESQPQDVSIAVHITNDDTINYADELESLSDTVGEHTTAISDLELEFGTLDSKVDGLNANNISYDEHSTLYSAMGDIDSLETESKNLVGAINENFTSVSNGKRLIADAITDKGVTTSATDTFQTMANNIGEIEGGGTAKKYQYGFVVLNHPLSYYGINVSNHCIIFYNNTYNFVICELKSSVGGLGTSSGAIVLANNCISRYSAVYNDATHELTNVVNRGAPTGNVNYTGILYFNSYLDHINIGNKFSLFEKEI